jgi:hypothetical protein
MIRGGLTLTAVLRLRAEAVGTYSLKFFRQDFIADYYRERSCARHSG